MRLLVVVLGYCWSVHGRGGKGSLSVRVVKGAGDAFCELLSIQERQDEDRGQESVPAVKGERRPVMQEDERVLPRRLRGRYANCGNEEDGV